MSADVRPPAPGDDTFRAALLLAESWEPALNSSYRLGFENGYAAGFRAAEHEMADAWARAAKPIRDVLRMPARNGDALADHEQCPQRCGRCSRCLHALAWRARGGRPYLGAAAEQLIAQAQAGAA